MYRCFLAPSVLLWERYLELEGVFPMILGRACGYREAVGRCMEFGTGSEGDIDIDKLAGRCK